MDDVLLISLAVTCDQQRNAVPLPPACPFYTATRDTSRSQIFSSAFTSLRYSVIADGRRSSCRSPRPHASLFLDKLKPRDACRSIERVCQRWIGFHVFRTGLINESACQCVLLCQHWAARVSESALCASSEAVYYCCERRAVDRS